jgi:hypothetical protein
MPKAAWNEKNIGADFPSPLDDLCDPWKCPQEQKSPEGEEGGEAG